MNKSFSRLLPAAMILAALTYAVAAPGPKTEAKPDKASAGEAIRKALDANGTFEFSDSNLGQVAATLSEQYKITITLDRAVIQQMGFEPEIMNVQCKMKDVKLRTALRTMLSQFNLTYAIVGDSLLITTEEMAVYRQLKQRINVEFDNVPLNKALKELSTKYGVNVVFDPKAVKSKAVEAAVSLSVEDVPFEAAVRLMCEMAELKPARMGNVIYVTTETRADKLKDGDYLVPAPKLHNPDMPFPGGLGNIGFAGGFGGGAGGLAIPPPAVAVPDKVEAPPAKDKEAKKD